MQNEDRVRLNHMLDAANEALEFVQNEDRDALTNDRKLVLALIKDIEIIGEAAVNVSRECQENLTQIPWRKIIGMRNRLIHGYFDINLDILWNTVKEDLPPLALQLKKILL